MQEPYSVFWFPYSDRHWVSPICVPIVYNISSHSMEMGEIQHQSTVPWSSVFRRLSSSVCDIQASLILWLQGSPLPHSSVKASRDFFFKSFAPKFLNICVNLDDWIYVTLRQRTKKWNYLLSHLPGGSHMFSGWMLAEIKEDGKIFLWCPSPWTGQNISEDSQYLCITTMYLPKSCDSPCL